MGWSWTANAAEVVMASATEAVTADPLDGEEKQVTVGAWAPESDGPGRSPSLPRVGCVTTGRTLGLPPNSVGPGALPHGVGRIGCKLRRGP